MSIVYLAGPIKGLAFADAVDWREDATRELARHNIEALSPMRFKGYLKSEQAIKDSYPGHVLSSDRGITTRDRYDCQRADIVLFNFLRSEVVSIGSCIEFGWADAARRPIIAVLPPDNPHDHAMIRELTGFRVDTLEAALHVAIAVLSPYAIVPSV